MAFLEQKHPKTPTSKSSPFHVALSSEGSASSLLEFIQEDLLPSDCHVLKDQAFSCTTALSDLDKKADLAARNDALKSLTNKSLLSFVADLLKSASKERNEDWVSIITLAHCLVQYLAQESDPDTSANVAKLCSIRKTLRGKSVSCLQEKDADIKLKLEDASVSKGLFNSESLVKVNDALTKQAPKILSVRLRL